MSEPPSTRVLHVDDHAMNRTLVRDILEYRGFDVTDAFDVDGGWSAFERGRFDVVLLDIQLEGGGGSELLRRIRATEHGAHLPVLALTAFAMDGDRERFLASGFDGYISKPIDTRTFADVVTRHLAR